jgi:phytoene synthase
MDWVSQIVDPERRLALAYAPRQRRQALAALWALDEKLGAIVAATREPMLGEIRLAWWRDALGAMETGVPAGEPLLEMLKQASGDHRLSPAELARLPEGWAALLGAFPLDHDALDRHAEERGDALFRLSALLLGGDRPGLGEAGEAGTVWALTDLAARVSDSSTAAAARSLAAERLARPADGRWGKALRPLAVLTALARQDAHSAMPRRQGSPRRLAVALWAGMTGR